MANGPLDDGIPGISGSLTEITESIVRFQNFHFGRTLQTLNAKTMRGAMPPLPRKPKSLDVQLEGSVGKSPADNKTGDVLRLIALLRAISTNQGGPTAKMGRARRRGSRPGDTGR